MALPTLADLKAVCRIEHSAEDTLLTAYLAAAETTAERIIGRPIAATARTFTDEACSVSGLPVRKLVIPVTPYSTDVTDITVTDRDGTVLSATDDYRIGDAWFGLLIARDGGSFGAGPYTIAASVGLATSSEYARIEPMLSQAILDIAADLWHRRNASASTESTGGGVSTTYTGGIPSRAWDLLYPLTMVRVV